MKYSNFKVIKYVKSSSKDAYKYHSLIATVDVETEKGFWIFKKKIVETKEVISDYGICWTFVEDGSWANIAYLYKYWEFDK